MSVERSSVQVRPVREGDVDAVMVLAGAFDPAREQPGAVFVAVTGGDVVGVVSVNTRRHFTGTFEAYIGELAVAAHAARTGVGRLTRVLDQ